MSFLLEILSGIVEGFKEEELSNVVLKKLQKFDTFDFQNFRIESDSVNINIINSDDVEKYGIGIYMNESDELSEISITTEYHTETKCCSLTISKGDNVTNCLVQITLPRNLCYSLSSGNGNMKIEDVTSNNISILSNNGNVKLTSSVLDNITTTTQNGNVKMERCVFNDSKLITKNGNIKVILDNNAYQIITKTHHGNIKLSNVFNNPSAVKSLSCTTNNGNIKISC